MNDLFETAVLPLFEEHRADWLARARHTARRICGERGTVTIDDVRQECPPPNDVDPRVMGAVMRRPEFQQIGYRKSGRATCHNRPVAIFALSAGGQA